MAMKFSSDGLTMILLSGLGVSMVVHIILPGSADAGLTPGRDIKLDIVTNASIILKRLMFPDFDINFPTKSSSSNKLPSFARSGIICSGKKCQLLLTYKPLASYFGTGWATLPQKPPQRFLMYADLPGSIPYIYETF